MTATLANSRRPNYREVPQSCCLAVCLGPGRFRVAGRGIVAALYGVVHALLRRIPVKWRTTLAVVGAWWCCCGRLDHGVHPALPVRRRLRLCATVATTLDTPLTTLDTPLTEWQLEECRALIAEGLDPDDPAGRAAIDMVRWELSR